MKIHIDDIPSEGMGLELSQDREPLSKVVAGALAGQTVERLDVELSLSRLEDMVIVEGSLDGKVVLSCSRCLEPVPTALRDRFRFVLRAQPQVHPGAEVELTADDLDVGFLEGASVEIDQLLEEQIVLAMPSQPLCREDCKGICQRCGAELNREACRCQGEVVDFRFEILKKLKR